MPKKFLNENERDRQLLAQEAARIIVDQGLRDYRVAKIKAAERLGMHARGALPGNTEIELAIAEHLLLFGGDSHSRFLQGLRATALAAMRLLEAFSPRLVGPVLAGTADDNSAINLHVFAESCEVVALFLSEQGYNCRLYERRLKSRRGRNVQADVIPGYEFSFDGEPVEATVFPIDGIRQAPLSPINGKPMRRADQKEVAALVQQATSEFGAV